MLSGTVYGTQSIQDSFPPTKIMYKGQLSVVYTMEDDIENLKRIVNGKAYETELNSCEISLFSARDLISTYEQTASIDILVIISLKTQLQEERDQTLLMVQSIDLQHKVNVVALNKYSTLLSKQHKVKKRNTALFIIGGTVIATLVASLTIMSL